MLKPNTNWHLPWKCTGRQPRSVSWRKPPQSLSVLLLGMICPCVDMRTDNSFSFNLLTVLKDCTWKGEACQAGNSIDYYVGGTVLTPSGFHILRSSVVSSFLTLTEVYWLHVNRYPDLLQRG